MEKVGKNVNAKTYQKNQVSAATKLTSDKKAETKNSEVKKIPSKVKVELSQKSKDLEKSLTAAQQAMKIHEKKFGNVDKPAIYFVSGFDWFGASSVKGNYDGIRDMAEAITGAQHYSWDQQDEILADIMKHKPDRPLVLVGHSFGGDGVVEIAQRLNTVENGFREVDLLVTLDSVGFDNDEIPQNVNRNINYVARGPYNFLNDSPNIALDYRRTHVENYLRQEDHAALDDTVDIQMKVLSEIQNVLGKKAIS